ncbi:hypothetical protein A6C57_08560 [Fibrella sp. ES10-3-2-2]|nr:hypothetical protein A6C57_08560 [Fibrella sp. ES10-3-2-2]
MENNYKNEPIIKFGIGFMLKEVIEAIYDDLFSGFEKDLIEYNNSIHKLDVQELMKVLSELTRIESSLPLPIQLKEEIIESGLSEDDKILCIKSFEDDRRRIVETVETLKKRVIHRLYEIDANLHDTLFSLLKKERDKSASYNTEEHKPLVDLSKKDSKFESKIFSQIKNPKHLNYILEKYKHCQSKTMVPMLYALTDLGVLSYSTVFNNQTKLHRELQELFDFKDQRQSLNKSITAHNNADDTLRASIEYHKQAFIDFSNAL